MTQIEKDFLNLRHNEFGISKISFWGSDKDVFPYRVHVVKWVQSEPFEAYSMKDGETVQLSSYNYAIGELEWDDHEPGWEFRSIGTRYLVDGTTESNKWLTQICSEYYIEDGELKRRNSQTLG